MMQKIPQTVQKVVSLLSDRGFDTVLVGGAVRDLIRGVEPGDFDVATSATPEEVMAVFGHTIPTGIKHGTVTVVVGASTVEVTTFRTDGAYADGRRPEGVAFVRDLKEDLSRRDFTINAMALRLGAEVELVDHFGGRHDLMNGVLRTVGSADERFGEDGLRAVRAARFAAVMDLKAADGLEEAMQRAAPVTAKVAVERFSQELIKMLGKAAKPSVGLHMLDRTGLLDLFMDKVGRQDFTAVDRAKSVEARLAVMMFGARYVAVERLLRDLKLSNEMVATVTKLVEAARNLGSVIPMTEAWVRENVRHAGGLPKLHLFLDVIGALQGHDLVVASITETVGRGFVGSPKELAINGRDIAATGKVGQQIGMAQRELMLLVDADPSKNTREALLEFIQMPELA